MSENGAEKEAVAQVSFGWKKTLLYSFLPLLALAALLEGGARVAESWIPHLPADLGQGFNRGSRVFVPWEEKDGWLHTRPVKTGSFQNQEFPREKPEGELRLVMIGGSSVNYLDYWFTVLEKRLEEALSGHYTDVRIINCGGLSYGSHRLAGVAAEILEYDPDLVMIYSGHNEFEEIEQLKLAQLDTLPLQRGISKSAFLRYLRDWIARRKIARLQEAHAQRQLADAIPDTTRAWSYTFTPEEKAERMDAYRQNLTAIIEMCLGRGVPVIIGTVPSNLMKPALPGADGQLYEEVRALFEAGEIGQGLERAQEILRDAPRHQASDRENGIIRELAAEFDLPLADVEKAVIAAEPRGIPGETLFSDNCHLTHEGNGILIGTYEPLILDLFK
jgi:hypothetical protein